MKRSWQMKRRMSMNMFMMLGAFHIIPVGIDNTVRVNVKVNDDAGAPVENAIVSACTNRDRIDLWTNSSPEFRSVKEKTDKKGSASLVFPCYHGNFVLAVSADGYYAEVPGEFSFKTCGAGLFTVNLAEYEKNIDVTLYRKKSPVAMYVRPRYFRPIRSKAPSVVCEYDMEKCDYRPPYGHGERCDMRVEWERVRTNDLYECKGKVTLVNGGAYVMKKRKKDEHLFCSVYRADTNRVYKSEFPFRHRYRYDKVGNILSDNDYIEMPVLTKEEYFVFRTRERRSAEGKLLAANYGKLYGDFRVGECFGFEYLDFGQCSFNPNVNDNNLEVDTTVNLNHGQSRRESIELRRKSLSP